MQSGNSAQESSSGKQERCQRRVHVHPSTGYVSSHRIAVRSRLHAACSIVVAPGNAAESRGRRRSGPEFPVSQRCGAKPNVLTQELRPSSCELSAGHGQVRNIGGENRHFFTQYPYNSGAVSVRPPHLPCQISIEPSHSTFPGPCPVVILFGVC